MLTIGPVKLMQMAYWAFAKNHSREVTMSNTTPVSGMVGGTAATAGAIPATGAASGAAAGATPAAGAASGAAAGAIPVPDGPVIGAGAGAKGTTGGTFGTTGVTGWGLNTTGVLVAAGVALGTGTGTTGTGAGLALGEIWGGE